MKTNTKADHWSNYWQAGQLTSLPQDFKTNYDGVMQDEWAKCFSLLDNKSTVLDLCTGNCAIALLASLYACDNNKKFTIHAADAANIEKSNIIKTNPSQECYLKEINLIPNCKIEDLQLPKNQFDLITSQYGIEYTNWKKSAEKVVSLLKPKAQFTMICHCGSTQIVRTMKNEQKDYNSIFNIGLFNYFEQFAQSKISYNKFKNNLKRVQKILNHKFSQTPTEMLRSILMLNDSILNTSKENLEYNRLELNIIGFQHKSAFKRMSDLLNVSLKINNNPKWFSCFIDAGLRLQEQKSLYHKGNDHSGELYKFVK